MSINSNLIALGFVLFPLQASQAVSITLGQIAGRARFFATVGVPASATAKVSMGWMSDPVDANSFVEFSSAYMHGNTVFTSGVGTIAGNSQATELPQAAGKNVFIRVIDVSGGGIWMSSALYPPDLTASSVTPGSASLTTDTWTVVQPTLNWHYWGAAYIADVAPLGLSDASPTPTQRIGDGFYLFIPEPNVAALSLLSLGVVSFLRSRIVYPNSRITQL